MNCNETLRNLLNATQNKDYQTATCHAKSMLDWLNTGGEVPTILSYQGKSDWITTALERSEVKVWCLVTLRLLEQMDSKMWEYEYDKLPD